MVIFRKYQIWRFCLVNTTQCVLMMASLTDNLGTLMYHHLKGDLIHSQPINTF